MNGRHDTSKQALLIERELEPPGDDGVVEVWLRPAASAGASYLNGYFGPSDAVAGYASDDQVQIPPHDKRSAMLVKVLVEQEHRRGGIGGALVKDFVELCRVHSVDSVYLYAARSDDFFDLVEWYEGLGFERLDGSNADGDIAMVAHLKAIARDHAG